MDVFIELIFSLFLGGFLCGCVKYLGFLGGGFCFVFSTALA